MTQEEKAKAYEESLERAKDFMNGEVHYALKRGENIMCWIFPELKESEDERIRRDIIRYLKKTSPAIGENIEKMLAWLEKQGESTDINPSEFDLRLNKLLKQFETLPKEELASSLSFYLNIVQNNGTYKEKKQGEQKLPIEKLSSEMKTIGESLGFTTQEECDKYNQMVTDLIMSDDGKSEQKPTDKEMKTLLRTEYEKGRADAIAEIQNPAWSEEDESYLNTTIAYLKDAKEFKKTAENCINWLKSLRPQNRWKPSDEQTKALHDLNLTGNISYAGQGQVLIELYNDLKKLAEE